MGEALAARSLLAAAAFGGVALVVPGRGLPAELAHLFRQCVVAYHQATESAAGIALFLAVGVLVPRPGRPDRVVFDSAPDRAPPGAAPR